MSAPLLTTPLEVDEGATFVQPVVLTDPDTSLAINLTGYTAKSEVRLNYDSDVLVEMTCTIPTPANGTIVMTLTPTQTLLPNPPFTPPGTRTNTPVRAVWDLFLTDGTGVVTRILKGTINFYPRVTD